jgi:alkylmercury lyase
MTPYDISQLADELYCAGTLGRHLCTPLLRLLAAGEPVSIERLARAMGRTPAQVTQALQTLPSIEYDAVGNIVGAGLTLNPTPHQFSINGRTLYTWCALDTLFFPALLEQSADIVSPTPGTGTPVRLSVTPHIVQTVDPAEAVVSIVKPSNNPDVRQVFCVRVHFFSSADIAEAWLTQHPGGFLLPVADAFALGQQLAARCANSPLSSIDESC